MKVLIDIPEKTYAEVKNKLRGTFLNPKDEHALIQSFRNGRILINNSNMVVYSRGYSLSTHCNGLVIGVIIK